MIQILISTFNGSKYISEQLKSIIHQQTNYEFEILIRDDGSTDDTCDIILSIFQKFSFQRYTLIRGENIGYSASFLHLIKISNAEIYFFCDQDDIWKPYKMNTVAEKFKTQSDSNTPYLLHSDFKYVSKIKTLKQSYFQKTNFSKNIENRFLFRGFIPGCSMAFNNALKQKCIQINSFSSHDLLIYFMAKTHGRIESMHQNLMDYRLHDQNTVGIGKKTNFLVLVKDLVKYFLNSKGYREIVLKEYFINVESLDFSEVKRIEYELYNKRELEKLSWLNRKLWFSNHFYPCDKGIFEAFIKLCLI